MKNEKSKIFDSLLKSFENEDIKEYAVKCIEQIPDYFWEVGASSTGKYHPQYTLGELGLAKHTYALVKILNYILGIDCFKNNFTSRERDLMRVAGIMHDSKKSGEQESYEQDHYTKFDHPLLAANTILAVTGILPQEEMEYTAQIIASHMGQWNTKPDNDVTLPLPTTEAQKLVHLADYLASRKDIEIVI